MNAVAVVVTERERQVLQLVADGFGNERIAAELGVTVETVKSHLRNAYPKLGARSRSHAVGIALRARVIR